MRILIVLFSIASFILSPVYGQMSPNADDMLQQAKKATADTTKATLLVEAAELLNETGRKKEVVPVLQEARKVLANTPHLPAQVNMYKLLSSYYGMQGKKELRHLYADSMIIVARKNDYKAGEAKGLLTKAIAFAMDKNMEASLQNIEPAIEIFQTLNEPLWLARSYKVMGNNMLQFKKTDDALRQYRLAVVKFLEAGAEMDAALVYANMARTFAVGDNYDSAIAYNNKAGAIAAKIPVEQQLHFMVAMSDAEFQSEKGNFVQANLSADNAVRIANKLSSNSMLGGAYFIKATIARNGKDYKTALQYDLLTEKIHQNSGDFSQLTDVLKYIANDYYNLGKYKEAYDYYRQHNKINDSLYSTRTANQINDLNVKYATVEKEKKIAEQELALSKKNARLKTLLVSLAAAGVAILLLGIIYFQRKKTYQQSLVTLKKEQDISLLKALMTGEEKERNRLARELHDGLGGMLAAAQMQVSHLEVADPNTQATDKQKAGELINKAATEARRIAHNLLPETLLRFGLNEAMQEYCLGITNSKLLQLNYESVGLDKRLDSSVELSIYRIIQELINNIIKHAGATEALVQLHQHDAALTVTVEDNGKGFSPGSNTEKGIGLSNIESRISYLNGSMDIRSQDKKGTSVYIEIQLEKNG